MALVLVVSLATSAVHRFVYAERLDAVTVSLNLTRDSHNEVVEAQSALRAWVATADRAQLASLDPEPRVTLEGLVSDDVRALGEEGAAVGAAYDQWLDRWALPLLEHVETHGAPGPTMLSPLLHDERRLFDRYRAEQAALVEVLRDRRDGLYVSQRTVETSAGAITLVLIMVVVVVHRHQRRRLRQELEAPIEGLVATVERVAQGDLRPAPTIAGPPELRRLGDGVSTMVSSLERSRAALREREQELRGHVLRQSTILEMERTIASASDPVLVAEAVAVAAATLGQAAGATTWLWDGPVLANAASAGADRDTAGRRREPGDLVRIASEGERPRFESEHPHGGRPGIDDRGDTSAAWPIVLAGTRLGVVEIRDGVDLREAPVRSAIETMVLHAAAALSAAHANAENARLARVDELTQLPNRRAFEETLHREVAHAERQGRALAFVMIDLDRFKSINDTFGHRFGDEVLRRTAAAVRSGLRAGDIAFRLGGEEMGVLARDTDLAGAVQLAERIRVRIGRALSVSDGDPVEVTASLGVATRSAAASEQQLVDAADEALYEAKRSGRNRVVARAAGDEGSGGKAGHSGIELHAG